MIPVPSFVLSGEPFKNFLIFHPAASVLAGWA
jgi:hypothetical protein